MDRVCFYSSADLSIGPNLELAKKRIKELENDMPTDLNGIIELWHIRKLFENVEPSPRWLEEFEQLKVKTSKYNCIVARYFKQLEPTTVANEYKKLEWKYRKTFWIIIDQFKCFNAINADTLKDIIMQNVNSLRNVLYNSRIVERYKQTIREILLHENQSAHLLLDEYVASHLSSNDEHLHFPSCLTIKEREEIVERYLESEKPNLNYVRLITQAKNVDGKFILSAKIRLKAERLVRKLNDELMHDPRTCITQSQVEIAFSDIDDKEIMTITYDQGFPSYNYRKRFIDSCSDRDKVIYCGQVFDWMDNRFMVNLINKNCEVDGLEYAFMDKSKTAYPNYQMFEYKNRLAMYQLNGYYKTLLQLDLSLEGLLEKFYNSFLNEEFGYPGLQIRLPKSGDGWLEKCRIIFPELDNIARQYDTYVDEDEIDSEYLSMLPPMKMTESKSLLANKYYEANEKNPIVGKILFNIFASGSLLYHVEPHKDKHYHSLANMIAHENVFYNKYEEYQKRELDFLIENRILKVDESGIVRYVNEKIISALSSIWKFGCCSYWHYDEEVREYLDELLAKGWLITDGHLLTKQERQYFSYYTDNSEFTNGYAFRNHYAHGCTPLTNDDNAHAFAYFSMLRLLIIIMLKIYDDLWLARRVLVIGMQNKSI